jgi:hypothetical protein
MSFHDPALSIARDVAINLLDHTANVERFKSSGRNSRIYRVRCNGRDFALKQYPPSSGDSRNRLSTEVGALRFMEDIGIDVVPRVLAIDHIHNYALMTWFEGSPIDLIDDGDIDQSIDFLTRIHRLRNRSAGREQPMAAEACLSGKEIERQITERLTRLLALPTSETALRAFLSDSFAPAFQGLLAEAQSRSYSGGVDFSQNIPLERRSLVPSDFGFHNCVRRPDGSLAFLDFEYFGWDDPVKVTADFLLHPGLSLSARQQLRFRQGAERLYSKEDPTFAVRLASYQPLFALRWTLIVLNEFIPERWQRRLLAGAIESWDEAKTRQLQRANEMLAAVLRNEN